MSAQAERSVTVGMAEPSIVAGRYLLGERLGSGGMAQVYRAHDEVLGRDVAVKVFGPSVDPHAPDRIRTEMRTHAVLSHPTLVTVHDAGTDEPEGGAPRAFLVMELIDGPTLSHLVAQGPLSPEQVTEIGLGVSDALAYVHSKDVVHRDVKPANILLDSIGQPHLADFGIAQTLGQAGHTMTGFTVGTAPYLSPEQVLGRPVTAAADIYALGLVLLESLTGRREYPGLNAETALARLSRPPVIGPNLEAPWVGLLTAMTDQDPLRRPTAAEVHALLRNERPAAAAVVPTALAPRAPASTAPASRALAPTPTRLIPAYAAPTELQSTGRVTPTTPANDPGRVSVAAQVLARVRNHSVAAVVVGLGIVLILIVSLSGTSGPSVPKPAKAAIPPSGPPAPTRLNTDLAQLRQLVTP